MILALLPLRIYINIVTNLVRVTNGLNVPNLVGLALIRFTPI